MSDRKEHDLFLNVENRDGVYFISSSTGQTDDFQAVGEAAIGPNVVLKDAQSEVPGEESLGKLLQRLMGLDVAGWSDFGQRFQTQLGNHLFRESVGRIPSHADQSHVHLRIKPVRGAETDEHALALPWPLLCRDGIRLSMPGCDWAFSLHTAWSRPAELPDVEMSPTPRMLMVMPAPKGPGETQNEVHSNELRRLLRELFPKLSPEDYWQSVSTWRDFERITQTEQFDLVYYYGHGESSAGTTQLLFETRSGGLLRRPVSAFADALAAGPSSPTIIYVNCCQGDTGGILGAGHQLSRIAPCVITNRTIARIDSARRQAVCFWEHILRNGLSPHRAIADLYREPSRLNLTCNEVDWFTPVVHANYRQWKSRPVRTGRIVDPHWDLKLDRVLEFGGLVYLASEALKKLERRKQESTTQLNALGFLWFGDAGQGMRLFHERLELKLEEALGTRVRVYQPRWPDAIDERDSADLVPAWTDMICDTFHVQSVDDVAAKLRTTAPREKVILLSFPHIESEQCKRLNPVRLLDFLHWFDSVFLKKQPFGEKLFLTAFSYECKPGKSKRFGERLEEHYSGQEFRNVVIRRLPTLGPITRQDLQDFLDINDVYIDPRNRAADVDQLMISTNGDYEAIVTALQDAIREGRYQQEDDGEDDDESSDFDDEDEWIR